ncbi:flagellar basal-body rod protein FlgG [Virgibacillus pantothenticus]|uniref:Flagellar basal body rod protein FlgG n=1 Tax=Virgibacillus pantothenticus TaxID=1473 RepID=A0A0L0QNQ2_VIRPA|nr:MULTISPECIES: flagellar basal body rod protein FlgG [Virgibacillus]API93892.1 flagellar basal-body rod protein FlgF [Virgibacillus sp. 6R]KNE20176.1 flagellar basal body rod protein FlgG [Virgibacillus pantothenticus]MBS7427565.1 flagellar basal body rod protein FlgG [Virgibacillus sp. 19R1-5]MBU8565945.1 flagellar basal body rod protein FlgG [Virgibacillus pantothenticus]MBU8600922.1 flagellar basal body rod protein FlgG [Virgibacillus pantothenticus]
MLRSMYAGISGMKGFQTKLDVIGNNIANVNTSGFKKGRVTFQDMMSQTNSGAQGPTATRGGINPVQVGTGSQLGSIDNVHTQGFRQTTGRPLDLMLEGDGMFIVQGNGTTYYTRAGNFYLDNDGRIVDANGFYLQDIDGRELRIPQDAKSFSIESDGTITYVNADGDPVNGGQIALASFSNPGGLEKAGSNLFLNSENAGYNGIVAPESDGAAKIVSSALEMSNVDLSEEFTEMITAQRGFQANTRIITTSDEILQELVNLKR